MVATFYELVGLLKPELPSWSWDERIWKESVTSTHHSLLLESDISLHHNQSI